MICLIFGSMLAFITWGWDFFEPWPVDPPPIGIETALYGPTITPFDEHKFIRQIDDHNVIATGSYELQGRVLSRRTYGEDSAPLLAPPGHISPVNLVLGWGLLSDTGILDSNVKISNVNQLPMVLNNIYKGDPSFEGHYVGINIVPGNDQVAELLGEVRVNQTIKLKGFTAVVKPIVDDGDWFFSWSLETDQTRHFDLYVTDLEIVPLEENDEITVRVVAEGDYEPLRAKFFPNGGIPLAQVAKVWSDDAWR